MSRLQFDDYKPFTVEETWRGWFAGEGGLGARGTTREDAIAKLRTVQALVRRLAARQPWHPFRNKYDLLRHPELVLSGACIVCGIGADAHSWKRDSPEKTT